MIYLKVKVRDGLRQYTAINAGAKGRTFLGTMVTYENKPTVTERESDVLAFCTWQKELAGGTYTDDRG